MKKMQTPIIFLRKLVGLLLILLGICVRIKVVDSKFDDYYYILWGADHVIRDGGSTIQLYMDKEHGGAGFESKHTYGSGFIKMRIKVPGKESAGVVTAFYLTSGNYNNHDELDFEFLGNRAGKPYTLQTNIFINGQGNREQRIHLWFDPTAHFHTYKILWNQNHIVFYVDNIPIREFKNNSRFGVPYQTQPMRVEASLWDGESWATDGGKTKTNWNFAPFRAYFNDFNIDGCLTHKWSIKPCNAYNYWWNKKKYQGLNSNEVKAYKIVRNNYLNYDYCTDKNRRNAIPPECSHQ